MIKPSNYEQLKRFFHEQRGDSTKIPDASIAIPVNAQGDLETVLDVLNDIAKYKGRHTFEVILAINNYPEGEEPPEIEFFRSMGVVVEPTPSVRRPEEAVCFSARMTGVRAAQTDYLLLFDADCRIPNATALIDWYIDRLHEGAGLAYTHVDYYDLRKRLSIAARMLAHHGARWVKRQLLGIPTTRGSNYAVNRSKMLSFYEQGHLSDDINVGPTFKAHKFRIDYSGNRQLVVLTSGRMFTGGWRRLIRYLLYRLRYNLKMLPVGQDVTARIQRGSDNIRNVKAR
ncbi:MAG: glycosyltransferase family 2 protein [Chloroflexota bacterium]|nr:glycosyltransferase family 2 protein [Chloroflexota bacterium]